MTPLQKAARMAIAKAGTVRKAAELLGMDPANLHRIASGKRRAVTPATALKLGFEPTWRRA
jgi:DNA-binding Xre family transcriptional regulator